MVTLLASCAAASGRVEAMPPAICSPKNGHWARADEALVSQTGRRPRPAAHGRIEAVQPAIRSPESGHWAGADWTSTMQDGWLPRPAGHGRMRSDGEPTTDAAVGPTASDRSPHFGQSNFFKAVIHLRWC